jgi:hypothetical protein
MMLIPNNILEGAYPIMVFIFICTAEGTLLHRSLKAQNYIWAGMDELSRMLDEAPERIYPIHVDTLRTY